MFILITIAFTRGRPMSFQTVSIKLQFFIHQRIKTLRGGCGLPPFGRCKSGPHTQKGWIALRYINPCCLNYRSQLYNYRTLRVRANTQKTAKDGERRRKPTKDDEIRKKLMKPIFISPPYTNTKLRKID